MLDGTQFSAHFSFADGTIISAKGYGRTPENFSAVTDEIVTLLKPCCRKK